MELEVTSPELENLITEGLYTD